MLVVSQPLTPKKIVAMSEVSEELILEEVDVIIPPVVITKYEFVSMVGYRARQLDNGDDPVLEFEEYKHISHSSIKIAELEVRKGVCPVVIRRTNNRGVVEIIRLTGTEIILDH